MTPNDMDGTVEIASYRIVERGIVKSNNGRGKAIARLRTNGIDENP